jgi:cyclopropane-fatty-acyl-phospholipid synthase
MASGSKHIVEELLAHADIKIGGNRPWDLAVHDERFYDRVMAEGSLGLGESYMDGWWDCTALSEFFYRLAREHVIEYTPRTFSAAWHTLKARLWNLQTKTGSLKVAREHYDLGNDLYDSFLDPFNQYTCGYFKDTEDLNEAQEKKLDMICRKLQLKPTDKVLDIGCGWGGFSKFAASRYGCHVTGLTISKEQAAYAREFCKGLPVEIVEKDYRDVEGSFDKVLICGMIEHVGYKNYRTIIESVHRVLKDSGLFLLHTIGRDVSGVIADPWIEKYIFPHSMLPSIKQLSSAFEGLFVMEDWHNFGVSYAKTLHGWYDNFTRNWHTIESKYGNRFKRMWEYYLLSCEGVFRARGMHLWQIVLSKEGVLGGYVTVR